MEIGAAGAAGLEALGLRAAADAEEDATPGKGVHRGTRRQTVLVLTRGQDVHGVALDLEVVAPAHGGHALESEEPLLAGRLPAGVAGERARAADDPVAGDHDGQRVPAERLGGGPHRFRPADLAGQAPVRHDGAIRDGGGRLQHLPVERASRQTEVEGPCEPVRAAFQIVEKLPMEALDLARDQDGLDPRGARQPGFLEGHAAVAPQVLHQQHPLLGPGDHDVPERRGEDLVGDETAPEVEEPRLEALAGPRHGLGLRPLARQPAHLVVDGPVLLELPAARRAVPDVVADAPALRRLRVPRRRGHEIGLDLDTRLRSLTHARGSFSVPSRARRIFFKAWKTWARALSVEHWRLSPIAS